MGYHLSETLGIQSEADIMEKSQLKSRVKSIKYPKIDCRGIRTKLLRKRGDAQKDLPQYGVNKLEQQRIKKESCETRMES